MKRIYLLSLALASCGDMQKQSNPKIAMETYQQLDFSGKLSVTSENLPRGAYEAIYKDKNNKIYRSPLPLNFDVINIILNNSNFINSECMAIQAASIFFQYKPTTPPKGSKFIISKNKKTGDTDSSIHLIDSDGYLWKISIYEKNTLNKEIKFKVIKTRKQFIEYQKYQ